MIVLLMAVALTGGLTADAFARSGGEGGGVGHGGGFGGGVHMGGGFGGGHFAGRGMAHFAQHHRHHRRGHQAFGLWPWYGYYDAPSYPYDDSYSTDSTPQVVAPEPPRPTRQHSEQTVTVPSENGGTREVTILRC
jgi:hypothetical protein